MLRQTRNKSESGNTYIINWCDNKNECVSNVVYNSTEKCSTWPNIIGRTLSDTVVFKVRSRLQLGQTSFYNIEFYKYSYRHVLNSLLLCTCTLLTYIFQFLNSNNETLVYYSVAQLLAKHTKLIYFIIARRITWKYHILLTLTYWHNFWLAFFSSFSIILYYLLLLCDVLTYITIRIYIWKCKCRHAGHK